MAQTPVGTVIRNVAQVTYTDAGGFSFTALSDTATVVVSSGYYLVVNKSLNRVVVLPGDTLSYTLTVVNTGNQTASSILLTDTLAAQLVYQSASLPPQHIGNVLQWSLTTLEPGQSTRLTVICTVAPATAFNTIIGNRAWASVGEKVFSSDWVYFSVGQKATLQLTKTVDKLLAFAGDTLNYSLTLRNTGNLLSTQTMLYDDIPDNSSFVACSDNGTINEGIITWSIGDLEPQTEVTRTVKVLTKSYLSAGTLVTNVANASNAQGVNSSATITTQISPEAGKPRLWLQNTTVAGAVPGDTLLFKLVFGNTGQVKATGVTLNDTLPDAVNFVAASGTYQILRGSVIVSWSLGALEVNAFDSVWVKTVVKDSVPSGAILSCRAGITCDQQVSAFAPTVTVVRVPQLYLNKSATSGTITAGNELVYTLRYSNVGDTTAFNTVLVDSLPADVSFVSATNGGSYNAAHHVVVWAVGNLPADMSEPLSDTLTVRVKTPLANGTVISNKALLMSAGGFKRLATVPVVVQSQPLLAITKQTKPATLPGDTLNYLISVSNSGSSLATQTVVYDTLAPKLEFIGADNNGQYDPVSRIVTWAIGTLNLNQPVQLSLMTRVIDTLRSNQVITNRVGVNCAENVPATAHYSTQIRVPQLTVSKTASGGMVSAGSELVYTIRYSNAGDTTAFKAVLVDSLSHQVEFISATNGGQYSATDHTVTWDIGDLPAAMISSDSVRLTVRIKSPLPNNTIITNIVTLGCAKSVGVGSQAAVAVTIKSEPVLNIIKTAPNSALPGDTLVYRLACSNTGNGLATHTIVTDTLPVPLEFVSASGNGQYNSSNRTVIWNLGDLGIGAQLELILQARISPTITISQELINRASISAFEGAASTDTALTHLAPLIIQVNADPDSIIGNGIDRTRITALVQDATGRPAPEGILVVFTATRGHFWNAQDTVATNNGIARTILVSDVINRESENVLVTAQALYPGGGTISARTTVIFYIGKIIGIVTQPDKTPVPGAIITVTTTSGEIKRDTTKTDGNFQLPVFKSDNYQLELRATDHFDKEQIIQQIVPVIIPDSGAFRRLFFQNALSGRIIDAVNKLPLKEANIPITLHSISTSQRSALAMSKTDVYTVVTDSNGFFYFTNLLPNRYRLEAKYNGTNFYHDGTIDLDNTLPGHYIINADIALRQTPFLAWKTVDKPIATTGDTLLYRIFYESLTNDLTDTFLIVDRIPDELELVEGSLVYNTGTLQYDGYYPASRELRFICSSLPHQTRDSLQFAARVLPEITPGLNIVTNTAILIGKQDSISTANDSRTNATTKIIAPFLSIKKSVNKRVIETGDILTYTVTLENKSADMPLANLIVEDILPPGFKYRAGRSYWGNHKVADPLANSVGRQVRLVWSLNDTLQPGKTKALQYRVIVGLDSRYGENENLAIARGVTPDGFVINSKMASSTVILRPGIVGTRGLIFGKVYIDENHDRIHNHGEPVLPGIEIITEEGIRVITDSLGKFSIPNVTAGEHVLRINQRTLPEGARIVLNSADFLGDSRSRLVKVSPGGIAKANFTIEPAPKPVILPEPIREESATILLTQVTTETDSAHLAIQKAALNQSFRLVVFKPWTMIMRLGFPSGSATLTAPDQQALRIVGDFLKWQEHITLEIHGHTNNLPLPPGARYKDNEELSWARAEAVKDFLIKTMGIKADRITTKGFGETQPIADNSTPEGLEANRRVELIFKTKDTCERFDKTIRYQVRMIYTGEISLQQVRFHEFLPEGFIDAPDYTFFNQQPITAIQKNGAEVVLDLGDWQDAQPKELIMAIIPENYHHMLTMSTSRSYLEWRMPDGSVGKTAELKNVIQTQVLEAYFTVILKGTQFDVGSYRLKPAAFPSLQKVGEFMQWQPSMTIAVQGFTDSVGSVESNIRLSENRANAVKDWLVKNYNIDPARIRTEGFGKLFPVADNGTPEGRALNRRVEIVVLSEFNQQIKVDVSVLADSLRQHLFIQRARTDTLNKSDAPALPAGKQCPLQLNLQLPTTPDVKLVRVRVDLPEGLLFADDQPDSLRRKRTLLFVVEPQQTEFSADLLLETHKGPKGEQTIRFSLETLDEKKVVKGTAKQEVTIRLQ